MIRLLIVLAVCPLAHAAGYFPASRFLARATAHSGDR